MFQRNMKASSSPMSAWNLIGENAQVATAAREREPGEHDDLAGEQQRPIISLGEVHAGARMLANVTLNI